MTKSTSKLGFAGGSKRSPSPNTMHLELLSKVKAKNEAIASQMDSNRQSNERRSPSKRANFNSQVAQSLRSLPTTMEEMEQFDARDT